MTFLRNNLAITVALALSLALHLFVLLPALGLVGARGGDAASPTRLGSAADEPDEDGASDDALDGTDPAARDAARHERRAEAARRVLQERRNRERALPPEERRQLVLGIDEGSTATMNWIGYAEYEQHLAELAEVEQAAFRLEQASGSRGTAPSTLPPAEPSPEVAVSPNPSPLPLPANADAGAAAPPTNLVVATGGVGTSVPAPTAPTEASETRGADAESARPLPPPETSPALPTPERPEVPPTEPVEQVPAAAPTEPGPETPRTDPAGEIPEPLPPAPRPEPIPGPEQPEPPVDPTQTDPQSAPRTDPTQPDPSPIEPTEPRDPAPSGADPAAPPRDPADPSAVAPVPVTDAPSAPRDPSNASNETNDLTTPTPSTPDAAGAEAGRGAPGGGVAGERPSDGSASAPQPPSPKGAPGDASGRSGELSDRESDPTSTIDVPMQNWRNGRPLAARGITLKPARPRFTTLNLLDGIGRNPIGELVIGRDGVPQSARLIRSTGNAGVDEAIRNALFRWRASGQPLEKLKPGQTITIRLRLIMLAD